MTMLSWLPNPRDFRAAVRAAVQIGAPVERFTALRALTQYRVDFLETIQLDRALQGTIAEFAADLPRVRVALLASATIDHLVPSIRVGGLRRGLILEVHAGAYGQYRQEVLSPTSKLGDVGPQVIVLSVTPREALAAVPLTATGAELEDRVANLITELRALWRHARDRFGASVIQQNFLDPTEPLFGSFDRLVPGSPSRIVATLNVQVAAAAAQDGVAILDVARASERDGLHAWFDMARWLQAKQEIAPPMAPAYGDLLARILAAQRGLSKKCLVLDLDNTLWGGVIGDDGVNGIALGEGSAPGEAHAGLQRYARRLRDRGIILAVCSKNDHAIAEAAIQGHPEMVLRMEDFAAFRANWEDKATNLLAIAAQLNLTADSLVFVDDNPAERARIRAALPMVAVPELPDDVADYVRCIAEAGYFEAVGFTYEDRHRASQYGSNTAREMFRVAVPHLEEFLRELEMTVTFGPFAPADLARVTQLINKTNQFNTTGRRHTAEEVTAFAARAADATLQFRLSDRFGDNGLVSVMILRGDPDIRQVLEIDTWVMSCRVFGRQLEHEAMNIAVETARSRGARRLVADFVPTAKNAVIGELYAQLGFTAVSPPGAAGRASRWELALDAYVPQTTRITRGSR